MHVLKTLTGPFLGSFRTETLEPASNSALQGWRQQANRVRATGVNERVFYVESRRSMG